MFFRLQHPACFLVFCAALAAQTNVVTYHNDNMRTGQNLFESVLTPQNVQAATFGKLLNLAVDGKVDAQPLVISALPIPGKGTHNVLFVATEHDSLFAFDADTGVNYWQVSLLKAGETSSDNRGCGQVSPEIGITGTPVIDPLAGPHGTIYVVAMSKDSNSAYHQRLHAIDITTGGEQFGGPVDVQASYPGSGDNSANGQVVFDPKQYKARTGLLLANGVVYTSWASHCDARPYTGWVISYRETTLAQTSVFNFAPNGEGAAVWGAGSGIAADSTGNLFFQIANGTFDPTLNASGFPGKADYGNAFVRLAAAGGALNVTDYWTMFNSVSESNADEDLGSGGVLLIPDVTDSSGKTRHLGIGVGKDADVYLFDRDNMGKFNPINNGNLYQELASGVGGSEFASPAWFNGFVYFGAVGDVIRSFKMTAATLGTNPSSTSAKSFAFPGTTPSISANGTSNGILWAVENTSPAVLHAYDANNLATELYNSNQAASNRDQFGAGNKFITPMIANGKVYVGTPNSVAIFGLLSPVLTSVNPASGTQGSSVNITLSGASFHTGATVNVSGTGVTAVNVVVVSATQITATLTIANTAKTGSYNVTVSTGNGTTAPIAFNVLAKTSAPTLTSITPSSGTQGAAVNVTLSGSNFVAGTSIGISGAGVAVSNMRIVSASQITATLTVSAAAAVGARSVTATNPNGTSNSLTFTVLAASTTLSALQCNIPVSANNRVGMASLSSASCTVTVSPSGTVQTVVLSSNSQYLTAPASVSVAAGSSTATFTIVSGRIPKGEPVILTATEGISKTFSFELYVALTSITCNPSTVAPGASITCTATFGQAQQGATGVVLSSNSPSIAMPGSVFSAVNASSVTVTAKVAAGAQPQLVTITGSREGFSKTFGVTIQ